MWFEVPSPQSNRNGVVGRRVSAPFSVTLPDEASILCTVAESVEAASLAGEVAAGVELQLAMANASTPSTAAKKHVMPCRLEELMLN